jgi:hypothetical protein
MTGLPRASSVALRAAGKDTQAYQPNHGPHGYNFGIPRVIPETAESTADAVQLIKKHFDPVGLVLDPSEILECVSF